MQTKNSVWQANLDISMTSIKNLVYCIGNNVLIGHYWGLLFEDQIIGIV